MPKVIFKDPAHQALFDKQGFIVLPFLNAEEITTLDNLFDSLHPEISAHKGFMSGSYSSDSSYKQKASDEVVKIFAPHYEKIFKDYQAFGAAFLYKMPDPNSQLSIHQDWTVVDEEKFVALNCWVPLTDVDATNGALSIVPGTHYDKIKTVRSPTLPFFFTGNDDVVQKAAVPLYVKAGEVVILDQSVIHYSPPNNSNKVRKAITAGVKTKGAPMVFHYRDNADPDAKIERFAMHENFLIGFDNFMQDILLRPKNGSSIGYIDIELPKPDRAELEKLISDLRAQAGFKPSDEVKPATFLQRLTSIFSA
jgi:hypothetical protein